MALYPPFERGLRLQVPEILHDRECRTYQTHIPPTDGTGTVGAPGGSPKGVSPKRTSICWASQPGISAAGNMTDR